MFERLDQAPGVNRPFWIDLDRSKATKHWYSVKINEFDSRKNLVNQNLAWWGPVIKIEVPIRRGLCGFYPQFSPARPPNHCCCSFASTRNDIGLLHCFFHTCHHSIFSPFHIQLHMIITIRSVPQAEGYKVSKLEKRESRKGPRRSEATWLPTDGRISIIMKQNCLTRHEDP